MPLFMLKKEVFEWVKNGSKTIEVRKGKAKRGSMAVFQCGRSIIRRRIVKKEEGLLAHILREDNYSKIIPIANSLQDSVEFIKKLYESREGTFTAYYFKST